MSRRQQTSSFKLQATEGQLRLAFAFAGRPLSKPFCSRSLKRVIPANAVNSLAFPAIQYLEAREAEKGGWTMAEPVSALPISPEPTGPRDHEPVLSDPREPVPWPESPKIVEPANSSASEKVEQVYEEVRSTISESYRSTQRAVSQAFHRGKRNAQYLMRERPLHVIAGVAVAAFLTGAALRVWRSNYG